MNPPRVVTIDLERLAASLKKARGGESLRDYAAKTGVHFSTLSRVEDGQMLDLLTYVSLCDFHGWKLDEFIVRWKVSQT